MAQMTQTCRRGVETTTDRASGLHVGTGGPDCEGNIPGVLGLATEGGARVHAQTIARRTCLDARPYPCFLFFFRRALKLHGVMVQEKIMNGLEVLGKDSPKMLLGHPKEKSGI